MRQLITVWSVLWLIGCGSSAGNTQAESTGKEDDGTPTVSQTEPTPPPPASFLQKIASSTSASKPEASAPPVSSTVGGAEEKPDPALHPPSSGPAGILLESDKSSTELSGCLAGNKSSAPTRSPSSPDRSERDSLHISKLGTGIIVTHTLRHACCLLGKVETKVDGHLVRIEEHLTGNPCRCMCRSTLKTSVGLDIGDYTVEVVLDNVGTVETVHREEVSLRSVRPLTP